jgi:menaquinone-dependent protoporphyrinogen oxidase
MSRILLIFASKQGQTAKIAHRISETLNKEGHSVDLIDGKNLPEKIHIENYSAVVVGGSVHMGGYSRQLKTWVKLHSHELNSIPSAFFSVCLGVLQNEPKVDSELERIFENFLKSSEWQPKTKAVFAGGLAYSKYNAFLKWWMKRISKKLGGDTDTSHDYEYTDWNAVIRFANEFSNNLSQTDRSQHRSEFAG